MPINVSYYYSFCCKLLVKKMKVITLYVCTNPIISLINDKEV